MVLDELQHIDDYVARAGIAHHTLYLPHFMKLKAAEILVDGGPDLSPELQGTRRSRGPVLHFKNSGFQVFAIPGASASPTNSKRSLREGSLALAFVVAFMGNPRIAVPPRRSITRRPFLKAQLRLARAVTMNGTPMAVEEIARQTGAHAPSLYRVMRMLASMGVFKEEQGKRFALVSCSNLILQARCATSP